MSRFVPSRAQWRLVLHTLVIAASVTVLASRAIAEDPALVDIEQDAKRIHENVLVLDSHVDIPVDYGTGRNDPGIDGSTQVDLPKLERGGVDAAVFAVFAKQDKRTPGGLLKAKAEADRKLKAILDIPRRYPHQAALALSAADVERIHREKKVAVIVGFLNAASLGTDLSLIDSYYRAGIRTFGFVHAGNNDFADSSRPIGDDKYGEHGGLSSLGREAVTRLNRLGVILDVSQLTPEALLQSVKLSKAPVVATHSAIKALVDSPRNLSDTELDAIKANGGVVQIVAFSYYLKAPRFDLASKYKELAARYKKDTRELSKEEDEELHRELYALAPRDATVDDLVNAITYAVKRIGIDHVGISSDFNHGGGIVGWKDESEALNVTAELLRRGYAEDQIAKLWGGNFLRVFRQVENVSEQLRLADSRRP
ncbi:MAG TPA: dipeptidase [Isosphaeraceae bacterium]|nr:dipeptidase [Isosphaeraceae bacterium]